MSDLSEYHAFLRAKVTMASDSGFEVDDAEINPVLKPHQRLIVRWAVKGGCRAIFAAFGLGKSVIQIEVLRLILARQGCGRALIVAPLGVRQEFARDAKMLGLTITFIRRTDEASADGLYITNYESVRDGKLNPTIFDAASLDEAAVLRGFGGTKTFREFMGLFAGDLKTLNERIRSAGVKYRFVATATPSPNEYIELLAYAAFLGIMDVSAAKTRFFKRDSTKADKLTIHPHKEREFWLWIASWALFVQKPSDLGCDDTGYVLPPIDVRWHEVTSDYSNVKADRDGQGRLFKNSAIGVQDAASEKRESLGVRMAKMMALRAENPTAHRIIWHDLEIEREAIEDAIPGIVTVRGADTDEHKEASIIGFSDGEFPEIAGKPVMLGAGVNWQRHCAWAIYLGIGFKFNDLIQSIHRVQRFLQTKPVRIDLIYSEAERDIRRILERKWEQHKYMTEKMSEIIKEFGLNKLAMANTLTRALGVERVEVRGEGFTLVNNDCVLEVKSMAADSVGLILTSIPFSTQYEYSPNYADFGHSDNNAQFFEQMDFLVPELLRVLQPGRLAAIHVKDRIVPSGMTGLGFQTVYPFHCRTIDNFVKHGFGYMGMKTIVTDVVRENNQTYRLGWSEQCKDGSKMGVGMPEYLLIFRKPPTDRTNSYADTPVVKPKPFSIGEDGAVIPFDRNKPMKEGTGYSRSRWQIDAHGFARSSGNRLLRPEELEQLDHAQIFKLFRQFSLEQVYDFEHHVRLGEAMEAKGTLPVSFMLLQPQSWHPDVWTDITRMLTLNGAQSAKGREMHLCPMQFDLADRAIAQWSMEGETVFDPFAGLATVPYRAMRLKRKGLGIELSRRYFLDGVTYCEMAAREMATPSLFDIEQPITEHRAPNHFKEIHMDQPVAALAIPTTIGTPFGGGFYMGRVFVGLAAYALVVAPKAEGEFEEIEWNESMKKVDGAVSYFDGVENTRAMATAGSKLAQKALSLRIGGHDDWFIPSRQDLLVIKGNEANAGELFAEDGAEAFERDWYWSSTQYAATADYAWYQSFTYGGQGYYHKDGYDRARAVRRVAI